MSPRREWCLGLGIIGAGVAVFAHGDLRADRRHDGTTASELDRNTIDRIPFGRTLHGIVLHTLVEIFNQHIVTKPPAPRRRRADC